MKKGELSILLIGYTCFNPSIGGGERRNHNKAGGGGGGCKKQNQDRSAFLVGSYRLQSTSF